MNSFHPRLAALAAALALSACGRHDDKTGVPVRMSRNPEPGTPQAAIQSGDIRITNTDNSVDLALLGDTISSGLSEQTLRKVRSETDTSAVQGSGLGASIEKMVKGSVQSAIGTRVAFPLSAVRGARYENGRIVFEGDGQPENLFKNSNGKGKNLLESFSPGDAQKFVDAVNARKRANGRT
ncbi:MAG: hypothetical protein JWM95_638 [Gemmatimonadetes bacterium]|nr:hypothetical protein [Gemmatimonadota bacterium]